MNMSRFKSIALILSISSFPISAFAGETATFTYDALGRLVRTVRTGGPASGVDAQIQYDAAGNRTNVTVSGSSTNSAPMRVIVLPLNGFTVMPLPAG